MKTAMELDMDFDGEDYLVYVVAIEDDDGNVTFDAESEVRPVVIVGQDADGEDIEQYGAPLSGETLAEWVAKYGERAARRAIAYAEANPDIYGDDDEDDEDLDEEDDDEDDLSDEDDEEEEAT
jgi:ribosomal protein L12E/L44/L45/RPP1/RPP2